MLRQGKGKREKGNLHISSYSPLFLLFASCLSRFSSIHARSKIPKPWLLSWVCLGGMNVLYSTRSIGQQDLYWTVLVIIIRTQCTVTLSSKKKWHPTFTGKPSHFSVHWHHEKKHCTSRQHKSRSILTNQMHLQVPVRCSIQIAT